MSGTKPIDEPIQAGGAPAPEQSTAHAAPEAAPQPEFKPHTDTPTLLDSAIAPGTEAPAVPEVPAAPVAAGAEAPPAGEEPAKPEGTEPAAPVAHVYPEKWEAPEGVQFEPAKIAEFNAFLGEHNLSPEIGQKLLNQHTAAMTELGQSLLRQQHETFANTREGWRKEVLADPQMGGAGHQTAMQAIARMRDKLVSRHAPGSPAYQADLKAFEDMTKVTGVGDNPAFLRMLHNAARIMDEPRMPPANQQPVQGGGAPKPRTLRDTYKSNEGKVAR